VALLSHNTNQHQIYYQIMSFLGLSQSCSLGQRQRLGLRYRQTQSLSLIQTLELRIELRQDQIMNFGFDLARYTNMLGELSGAHVAPAAVCPHCDLRLKPAEILVGFLPDPHDITVGCPRCKKRFDASVIIGQDSSQAYSFLCGVQLLAVLRGLSEQVHPSTLQSERPEIYYSALFHFGSVEGAYRQIGGRYPYRDEKDLSWHTKARPLLGNIRDEDIAAVLNVSNESVSSLREGFHIRPTHSRKSILPSKTTFSLS
jgi:hypothetical protein